MDKNQIVIEELQEEIVRLKSGEEYRMMQDRIQRLVDGGNKLRDAKRELMEALERFLAYGDIYRYRQWESSPYEQGKAAVSKHKEVATEP